MVRLFYNRVFSIASKNDLDDQNVLFATVRKEAFTRGIVGAIFAIYTSGRRKITIITL
jgi:hypothetical protein